jgi:thiamine biosynthesis protein ThiS
MNAQDDATSAKHDAERFVLNGEPHALPEDRRLISLFETLSLRAAWVLVELNGEPIARDAYDAVRLRPGDRVELVTPLAGG